MIQISTYKSEVSLGEIKQKWKSFLKDILFNYLNIETITLLFPP